MLAYLPLVVIPTLVVLGSVYAFILLLTGFFLWASIHVTHQAQYISETYRMRAGAPIRAARPLARRRHHPRRPVPDGHVQVRRGQVRPRASVLLLPGLPQARWVAVAFTVGYAVFFLFYVARTFGEIRRGETSWPRLVFMTMTVAMAFVVPLFDNLDMSFQGFNTWHSLQYLALTWFMLGPRGRERADRKRFRAGARRQGENEEVLLRRWSARRSRPASST